MHFKEQTAPVQKPAPGIIPSYNTWNWIENNPFCETDYHQSSLTGYDDKTKLQMSWWSARSQSPPLGITFIYMVDKCFLSHCRQQMQNSSINPDFVIAVILPSIILDHI